MIMQTIAQPAPMERDPYLEKFQRFEKEGAGRQPSWLFPIRKAGLARFAERGFPTLKDEDWRFTNVTPIAKLPFRPVLQASSSGLSEKALAQFPFANLQCHRLVFVDGHFAAGLSRLLPLEAGVEVGSLAAALAGKPARLQSYFGNSARDGQNAFAALNTAFFMDGAFIHVPAGVTVAQPVHLLFISTAPEPGATAHPRNLVVAGKDSRLTLLETYAGIGEVPCLTNAVSEFVVGENASVEHCKFQDEPWSAYHLATLQIALGARANFISHSIATGAKLSRNSIKTLLDGEGVECVLNGLYLTKDEQLADHHMIVEHAKPHCNSHEYFNGILDDRSRGVFHGRILVRQEAQKTDAKQTNKNLLLSDTATIDTKPQLEIYADDVKCTHGATVGQLNEESIFYLRARGMSLQTARRMLIHAFAGEIIDRIRCEPVRKELDEVIWGRLEQNPHFAATP
jgi:Fe-S cluster assembly protein SufD